MGMIAPRINLRVLADSATPRPLLGYRVCIGGTAVDVTRLPAETDDELHQRARTALCAREGDSPVTTLIELRGE